MSKAPRLVVTPAELGSLGVHTIRAIYNERDRLMPLLLPGMDGYFAHLEPGSLTAIIAQTHNGKSWFMRRWAERMLCHLQSVNRDEVVVWVDTEISAEYLALSAVARKAGISYAELLDSRSGLDVGALVRASADIAGLPLYTIATRADTGAGSVVDVTLTNIRNGLRLLRDGKIDGTPRRVAAVFVDYLQSLPYDPEVKKGGQLENQRRLQVSRDVDTCRYIGAELNCPVILGVQAKQDCAPTAVMKALALPGVYDGQETANIGQRPDRILSLSVGARNFPVGSVRDWRGQNVRIDDHQMFVQVLKQRGDGLPAGAVFGYMLDSKADPLHAMVNFFEG
jgi:hypothetical protein